MLGTFHHGLWPQRGSRWTRTTLVNLTSGVLPPSPTTWRRYSRASATFCEAYPQRGSNPRPRLERAVRLPLLHGDSPEASRSPPLSCSIHNSRTGTAIPGPPAPTSSDPVHPTCDPNTRNHSSDCGHSCHTSRTRTSYPTRTGPCCLEGNHATTDINEAGAGRGRSPPVRPSPYVDQGGLEPPQPRRGLYRPLGSPIPS